MQAQMLAPAAVLIIWTLIVLFYMAYRRLTTIAKLGKSDELAASPGGRGSDLDGVLPKQVNWPAHNHTHLHEQPTLFYALSAILAIMGAGAIDVTLAWVYVALRIVHSIWQIAVNKIPLRFMLFLISTIVLAVMGVRAVMATVLADPSLAPA